jgi:lipopolysaccharide biosynthesis glycosyltransferase
MAVALSIADTMKWPYRAVYHLIYDGPENQDTRRLQSFIHPRLTIRLRKAHNPLSDLAPKGYITAASLLRLIAPNVLPDLCRVIYLDVDVVVHRSLHHLFAIPLDGKPLAGAIDLSLLAHRYNTNSWWHDTITDYMDNVLRVDPAKYVNTGVLLIDLAALRRDDFTTKATSMARERHGTFLFFDQDVINVIYRDRIKLLDARWNSIRALTASDAASLPSPYRVYAAWQRTTPFITHYAGPEKPWHATEADEIKST